MKLWINRFESHNSPVSNEKWKDEISGNRRVPTRAPRVPWEQWAAPAGAASVLSSHSCLHLLPRLWLGLAFTLFVVSTAWFECGPSENSYNLRICPQESFSCVFRSGHANSSLLEVSYLLAQPFLFLSYRAQNAQKSATFIPCKAHLLKGKCFWVMYKFPPVFPNPGAVIVPGHSSSSPGERWQLCPSAWSLCPFAGLCQPKASS